MGDQAKEREDSVIGLDMYLSQKYYVGNKWRDKEKQLTLVIPENQEGVVFPTKAEAIDQAKISYIEVEVGYWRKANQIHNWFVHNVQGGTDDCGTYWVSKEKLEELVANCKTILETVETNKPIPKDTSNWSEWADIEILDTDEVEDLLPSTAGFFFGNTDYNGDYLYGLMETIEQIEPYLEKDSDDRYIYGDSDFYYSSSW